MNFEISKLKKEDCGESELTKKVMRFGLFNQIFVI